VNPFFRFLSWIVPIALVAAACSAPIGTAEPTTTSTTTAPVAETTTTSTAPPPSTTEAPVRVAVEGASYPDLEAAVADLYSAAVDDRNDPGSTPEGLIAAAVTSTEATGIAAREIVVIEQEMPNGDTVAVVHVGTAGAPQEDILFAYDTGESWRLLGGSFTDGTTWLGNQPLVMMAIGSDARVGQNQERLRADSLHMITLAPDAGGGAIVGFPRDTVMDRDMVIAASQRAGVPLDRVPSSGKWTHLMARRGPAIMLATAEELTGIDMDGYVLVGFKGFSGLINELGGLVIDLPKSVRTGNDWKDFSSGLQKLSAARTMHLARARKGVPGGDFGRSANQGLIMLAGMEMVQVMGVDLLPGLLPALAEHAFSDMTTDQLLAFGAAAMLVDVETMENVVVGGKLGWLGRASVVFLNREMAAEISADVGADGLLDGVPTAESATESEFGG